MISTIPDIRSRFTATTNTDPTKTVVDPTKPADPPVGAAEPSKGTPTKLTSNAMGKDEFLKMLVAQLKNQDPLNPMDGKDMAAQLAQFSTVEQLISMNKSMEAQEASAAKTTEAIQSLEKTQNERADELAQLIEGQMAMAAVGKIGITTGNTTTVDANRRGTILIDAEGKTGTGRITMINAKGEAAGTAMVGAVSGGQQSFDVGDYPFDPPLAPGQYTYRFEVSKEGAAW
jgi:flagellar basal-body rod modification protein FlgD